jgi:hypothetical protein
MYHHNRKFGQDQSFSEGARRVADLLWDNTKGDLSQFPKSYLEHLRHDFSDGKISMLEVIDRVDLGEDATYEDYCEVVESLLKVDPTLWPDPESVIEVPTSRLAYEIESEFDFSEFDFADEMVSEEVVEETPQGTVEESATVQGQQPTQQPDALSEKMELFFKKVISSVYLDGVTAVTDAQGNPPNMANNYLMSEDGTSFTGVFYDSPPNEQARKYPFAITENESGKWGIKY